MEKLKDRDKKIIFISIIIVALLAIGFLAFFFFREEIFNEKNKEQRKSFNFYN